MKGNAFKSFRAAAHETKISYIVQSIMHIHFYLQYVHIKLHLFIVEKLVTTVLCNHAITCIACIDCLV